MAKAVRSHTTRLRDGEIRTSASCLTDRFTSQPLRCPETGIAITRSAIMKRAHLLRRWNRGKETFGFWLARAWAEAKSGKVHLWSHLSPTHEVARLRTELSVCLNANRFDGAHYADLQRRLQAAERLAA